MIDINNIIEKRDILYSLAPFSEGVKALKRHGDLLDFTFSNLKLYGSSLTKEGVSSILSGNSIAEAPIFEHRLCEAHRKLLSRFEDRIHMDYEIDSILLNEFSMILSSSELPLYREGSPLLYHLDYVPGDDERISADLSDAFTAIRHSEKDGVFGGDFCLKASAVHMGILKVYPYAEGFSELSARTAAQYELVRSGYFPVDTGVSEQEYNRVCSEALRSGDTEEFAGILRAAVFRKLHMLIDSVERGV